MSIKASWRHALAAGALSLLASGASFAHSIAAVTALGNWAHGAGQFPVPGMVTPLFFNAAGQRFIVTYSAECSVDAPNANQQAWIDVDIVVLDAAGVVVSTLPPTNNWTDAFCSSNGIVGWNDGWATQTVTAVGGANLPAGDYRVQVLSRTNNGATAGMHGERALVVSR